MFVIFENKAFLQDFIILYCVDVLFSYKKNISDFYDRSALPIVGSYRTSSSWDFHTRTT